jgi:glycosyltransferase involved in cell wall biosynthesis
VPSQGLKVERAGESGPRLLFVEPYANASHRALARGLMRHVPARWTLLSLPGRHFRWRMRGAAAFLAEAAAGLLAGPWDGLFCSGMLGLAELRGLAPGLARVPALAYFHESQLAYPAGGAAGRRQADRDLYLAFSNLTTAAASRLAVFNSRFHRDGFLAAAGELLARLPDARPRGLAAEAAAKARVLAVPLDPGEAQGLERPPRSGPLRILWSHRWAQDKAPEDFFAALRELRARGREFELAVLGLSSGRPPAAFARAREELAGRIARWGGAEDRREYWRWLFWADLAVSTARQEYQGLALAEAAWAGCRVLAPQALVYPELYPPEMLYSPGRLAAALEPLAARPELARRPGPAPAAAELTWQRLGLAWRGLMEELVS